MARGTKERRRGTTLSITAAGRRLDVTDPKTIKDVRKRPFEWQTRIYDTYDERGEVWFAGRFIAESLSRLRVYPAVQPDPDEPPVPLNDETIADLDPELRPTDDEMKVLQATARRLTNSHGGVGDLMRGHGLLNFLGGESVLIGRTVEDVEEWEVHSYAALDVDSGGRAIALKEYPDSRGDDLIDLTDAFTMRVWRRHPVWPELPDTAMRPGLEYCEDLKVLQQMIRATARSRMVSGVLALPLDPDDAGDAVDLAADEGDGEGRKDSLIENLIKHFSTPLANPQDPASLVPFLLRLDPEDLKAIQKLDFSREIDRLAIELRRESRESFASTVDLPADVLTGKAGLNHWTSWNVDEQTFRVHIAPHAELIVDSWTSGYFWPNLVGVIDNPRRFRLWYDAGELVNHPDRAENAVKAHDRIAISDQALRDSLGFPETAAPDEAEVQQRIERESAKSGRDPGSVRGPESTREREPESSVTASARPPLVGEELARLERTLLERLQREADGMMRRALERAGNRLRSIARRDGSGITTDVIASCESIDVASRLGPSLVAALNVSNEDLLAGAFDGLERRWEAWTRRTQEHAIAVVRGEGELSDTDEAAVAERMREDRGAGWEVLRASLVALAAVRLFEPTIAPPSHGEFDDTTLVPAGALRDALQVAGGGPGVDAPGVSPATTGAGRSGLLSGDNVRDLFSRAALELGGWVWIYGDPSARTTPFEPHLDLDGVTFSSWEDDVLANPDVWPEVDFLYPGDHLWCQCTFARDGVPAGDDDAA